MSLPLVSNNAGPSRIKPKQLPRTEFSRLSNLVIERDFFPEIHRRRIDRELADLEEKGTDDIPKSIKEAIEHSNSGLDDLNRTYVSQATVDLQKAISDSKQNRNERLYGVRNRTDLNHFMFNHPGISNEQERPNSRINYGNTRLPENYSYDASGSHESELRERKRTRFEPLAARQTVQSGSRQTDILARGPKRKQRDTNL
jgi:hypothetical protein